MIIDGQTVDYNEWKAGDALRNISSTEVDNYFTSEYDSTQPLPGTSTAGYRMVYRDAENNLYPVLLTQGQLIHDIALGKLGPDSTHFKRRESLEGVHVDSEGRGYYYWPDRQAAEDYMRYALVEHETPFMPYPKAIYESLGAAPESFRKNLPQEPVKRSGMDQFPSSLDAPKIAVGNMVARKIKDVNAGYFELYKVSGTAVPNDYGDAGFIMNEMTYDDLVISIPVTEPWEATQKTAK